MERVTKTQDSSLAGEAHNTFLLSTVIKWYPTTCTHTHALAYACTHADNLLFKSAEKEAIEKETITGTAKHRITSGYKLKFLLKWGCAKPFDRPPGSS